MPVISNLRTKNRIDDRVQSGQITESGSAVARSLAGIGGAASNFANKLLLERKEHQASTFKNKQIKTKALDRQTLLRGLTRSGAIDPSNGVIIDETSPYAGMDLSQAMNTWEVDSNKRISSEAPTDLARRKFELSENPRTEQSMLQADNYQNQLIVKNWGRLSTENNEVSAKSILSHQEIAEKHSVYATGLIEDMERELDESRMVGPESKETMKKSHGNELSNAAIRTMLVDEQYPTALNNLDMAKLLKENPQMKGEVIGDFIALGLPVEDVRFLNDGRMVFTGQQIADGKSWVTSDGVVVDEKFVEKQRIKETKPIQIGGTFTQEENKILKYLSPDEQYAYARQSAKGLANSFKKSLGALRQDHKDILAGFRSVDPNLKLRQGNDKHKGALQTHLRKIVLSPTRPEVKKQMLVEAMAAVNYGDVMDDMKFSSPVRASRLIDGVTARVKNSFRDLGMGDMINDPIFARDVVARTSSQLQQNYNSMRKDMGTIEYQTKSSHTSAVFESNKWNSKEDYDKAASRRESLYREMGVSPLIANKFSDADVLSVSSKFEASIQSRNLPDTISVMRDLDNRANVMGDDIIPFKEALINSGVKAEIGPALLFDSSDSQGIQAQNTAFQNAIEKEPILQAFKDIQAQNKKPVTYSSARGMARGMLSDENLAIHNRFSIGDSSRTNDLVGLIALEGIKQFNESTAATVEEGVENAKDFYMKKNFSTYRKGNTSVVIPNAQVRASGYDFDTDTGRSKTLEKVIDTYSNPRNIPYGNGRFSWENDPVIKQTMDQLKLTGKARQDKLMELIEDGAFGGISIIPINNGLTFSVGNSGSQSMLVDNSGEPLVVSLEVARQDPNVLERGTVDEIIDFELGGQSLRKLFDIGN